jgi:hypothetical protein
VSRLARVVSGPGRAGQGRIGRLGRVIQDEAGRREVGLLAHAGGSEVAGPDRGGSRGSRLGRAGPGGEGLAALRGGLERAGPGRSGWRASRQDQAGWVESRHDGAGWRGVWRLARVMYRP